MTLLSAGTTLLPAAAGVDDAGSVGSWRYDACRLAAAPDGGLEFAVTVTNLADIAGSEVVHAYLRSSAPLPHGVERPIRWLAGVAQVTAEPGRTATATVTVPRRCLEVWHAGAWLLPAGDYRIHFGRSIRDPRLALDLRLPLAHRTKAVAAELALR